MIWQKHFSRKKDSAQICENHDLTWQIFQLIEAEWRIYASVNWAFIGSNNGLSTDWHQAIIWTNAGILLIGPLETNFKETPIKMQQSSFKKICLNMSSPKGRPFCLSLNVLM